MSLKLHTYPNNYRADKALIAAEYNGVKVETVIVKDVVKETKTKEYLGKFFTGKVPALETPEGNIVESNAIATYVAALRPGLLGTTPIEQAKVSQWVNWAANEIEPHRSNWLYPVLGYMPKDEAKRVAAKEGLTKSLTALNQQLATRTFLVGNRVTFADIVVFVTLREPFSTLMAPAQIKPFDNVVRWFNTVGNQKEVSKVSGPVKFATAEKTFEEEKKVEKPVAAASEDVDEDGIPREKKAKSPLDNLPESPMGPLDNTKKLMFSQRPILPDFFEKHYPVFDKEGYSWWTCKYNYDSENKVFYMTGNAVGGFIQRSDAARKYALGVMNIIGNPDEETPPFPIRGAWLFRGTEIAPEMISENPDSEYYTWTKVDVSTPEGQKTIKDVFMADKLEGMDVLDRRFFK